MSPASITWNSTQILGIAGVGGPLFDALGERSFEGKTLWTHISEMPQLLQRWSTSRARHPAAAEQTAFAKVVIALHEATAVCDVGGRLRAESPAGRAAASQPAAAERPFTEPNPVVRTRKRALLAFDAPLVSPVKAHTVPSTSTQHLQA